MPNGRIGSSHSATRDRTQTIHKSLILAYMAGKQMNRVNAEASQGGPAGAPAFKARPGDRLMADQHLTRLAMGHQGKGFKRRRAGEGGLQGLQDMLIRLNNKGNHSRVEARDQNVQISQTSVNQKQGMAWRQQK